MITTLGGNQVVHLIYKPNGLDEGNRYVLACMPNVSDFHTQQSPAFLPRRSTDTRAVTCPECKKTKIFEEVRKTERP